MADLDLARRAVACRWWRWMPGMRAVGDLSEYSGVVCAIVGGCVELALDDRETDEEGIDWHSQLHGSIGRIQVAGEMRTNHVPDLTDPATRGCLLQLVREAWQNQYAYSVPVLDRNGLRFWAVWLPRPGGWDDDGQGAFTGPDEVSALVAAMEAAPTR